MTKILRKLENCPNCDSPLTGENNYCAVCGQENTTKSVSIGVLVRDFLDDYFTLDSRLVKSIIPLITKPGYLTKEFNAGRRMKFVPPLRMYLVFSLLFFIIPATEDEEDKNVKNDLVEAHTSIDDTHIEIDQALNTHSKSIGLRTDSLGNRGMSINVGDLDNDRLLDKYYQDSIVGSVLDSLKIAQGTHTRKFLDKLGRTGMEIIADDGKKFANSLFDNIPTMMFFLLPVFAFLIQIFYFRQHPLYVESIIFSLHFHSFAFLMLAISDTISLSINSSQLEIVFFLAIVIYLIVSLRNVFNQKYFTTILKFFGLLFTYGFVLSISFVTTFLITILLY